MQRDILSAQVTSRLGEGHPDESVSLGSVNELYDEHIPTKEEIAPLIRSAIDKKELRTVLGGALESSYNDVVDIHSLVLTLNDLQNRFHEEDEELNPLTNLAEIVKEELHSAKYPTGLTTLDSELRGGLRAGS